LFEHFAVLLVELAPRSARADGQLLSEITITGRFASHVPKRMKSGAPLAA